MTEYKVMYRGEVVTVVAEQPMLRAGELLKRLRLSSVYAFVIRDGEVVDDGAILEPSASLEVINAISGG